MRYLRALSRRQEQWYGLRVRASMVWRGDAAAERASLENGFQPFKTPINRIKGLI
jgi:hypothetical protein